MTVVRCLLSTCFVLSLAAASPAWSEELTWLERAKQDIPSAWVAGRVIRIDEAAKKAFVAAFPAGADNPATPGNAFDPGQVLEVDLARENGEWVYAGSTMHTRAPESAPDDAFAADYAEELARLQAQAELEPGVMPCLISGWALAEGSTGTPVRSAPDDGAEIVGRLPPPNWTLEDDVDVLDGMRTEFDITGYRDGWFRIANAQPPGTPYFDEVPAGPIETYAGVGWIRATEAGGAYANSQMPVPRLLQSPNVDAQDIEPGVQVAGYDGDLSIDTPMLRLHACSAGWALTTSIDGQRGWWRGICSNQVTNCS